ncbi:MAG: hypothetical protein ACYTJ0_01625 [Planctomycetota bacterium]|jgi:hypothetical protein
MNNVLTWLKGNIFIVIFLVVMIAACVALPIVSGKLNQSVRKEVEKRAGKLTQLRAIEKTQIELPGDTGETRQAVLNKDLLDQYRRAVEAQKGQADQVYDAALQHNSKGRGVLMPELFPEPPLAQREVLPPQFHERLMRAYENLLGELGAGTPPDAEMVREDLERRRSQFLTQTLFTEDESTLDAEQLERLRTELRDTRTSIYLRRAQELDLYASLDAMAIPAWNPARLPAPAELFGWQWDFWVHEDVLRALAAANAESGTVIDAPIKRLVALQLLQGSGVSAPAAGGGGGGGGGMGPSGFGPAGSMGRRGAGGGASGAAAPAGGGGTPLDPKLEAALDYSTSLTGRQTNPLYDVRYADVVLLVDPRRIPQILDAIAARNFMTVTNLRMTQADPFEAQRQGYYFGSGPLAELTLRLETIWLRPWTSQFMPAEVRQTLGIPLDPPPGQPQDPA